MTNITERLIEFVKQQPCLYDSSHREYKNVANKTEIWEAIGKELNCTGEVVKNKWRTLRDGYTKNRKLMKEKGISKTYFWAPQLAFLENHLQRQPALNATSSPTPFCMDLDTNAGDESRASPVECKVNTVAEIPLEEPLLAEDTSAPDIRPAKRKNPEDDDDLTRIMNFLSRKKRNEDAVGHLFSSYAVTFRSFPAHEQIALKLKLAELFSNVELKLIEETERRQCILSGTDDQGSLKADDSIINQSIKVKVEPVDRTDIYHEDGPFAHNTTEANLATSADQEKILELLRQLQEKDVELNKAKDQIVALKNEVDALRTRNHSLETRNASLEAAVDDLKIRLNVV
ncbi:uncharacterized protein LOC106138961 isoform X2 [Amyelois transitella]|uniref:uncharacterized protein LOC106138961 isoform X2 n=1 Tax=Amyelois transitella TaxID=680683 RepID=UPI00298FCF6A|nr:uncharacterized protein LOC106138961 isoform X2 [Amyelois transitella]